MNLAPAGSHLLDTSAVILMLRHGVAATSEALVPFAAMGELLTGVNRAVNPAKESEKLWIVLRATKLIHPSTATLREYGKISAYLQRLGQPIPANDIWIAALALQYDLPLLSDDAHFQRVSGLKLLPIR